MLKYLAWILFVGGDPHLSNELACLYFQHREPPAVGTPHSLMCVPVGDSAWLRSSLHTTDGHPLLRLGAGLVQHPMSVWSRLIWHLSVSANLAVPSTASMDLG